VPHTGFNQSFLSISDFWREVKRETEKISEGHKKKLTREKLTEKISARPIPLEIRDAAKNSIGFCLSAKSLELRHTIRPIREPDAEIAETEEQIQSIMDELHSPLTAIPGMSFRMAAMILAEGI